MDLTFGVFVPQGRGTACAPVGSPREQWRATVAVARLAEELGYDSLWVQDRVHEHDQDHVHEHDQDRDHEHGLPGPAEATVLECWTIMAALSRLTRRVRLGHMVSSSPYRHPSVLAKITSTIDVISGGRLDLGISAGWHGHEHGHGHGPEFRGYGFDIPRPSERIAMVGEAVEIIRSMWTQDETTYDGTHFRTEVARCHPKPLQDPHPPVWIGGGGDEPSMLGVVARHADVAELGGSHEEWAHKAQVLRVHCDEVGRDYETIRKSWSPQLFVRETEAELAGAGSPSGELFESWHAGNLVGTPEQVAEKIEAYRRLGCTAFVPWCADHPSEESLRLFATRVMSEFR